MAGFFIRRPTVAMVISIVLVIAGLVLMRGLPIEKFPNITPPQVSVAATYVGADAVSVEESVATPIEQQVNGVDRMIYMQSTNANDGTMTLQVSFEPGMSPDIAQVLVQNRVAVAQARLPPSVAQYGLTVRKRFASPLVAYGIFSPHGSYDNRFLGNYATINIVDEILRVPGVGDVKVFGAFDYSMRIWVNPEVLANYGLTVADLSRAIQSQSTINPAGQVGGEPVPAGQVFTYTVGLVLHSDNGTPMRGQTMLTTLQWLGVVPSFSRPHVSNDNPYSESLFRTLKYTPAYPKLPFTSSDQASSWVGRFVSWYNTSHRHSAIRYVTPNERHFGQEQTILARRHALYVKARKKHPERWARNTRD